MTGKPKIDPNILIELGKKEIIADVRNGIVPRYVESFGDLHDYVDANCYGGLCDEQYGDEFTKEGGFDYLNHVQDALDAWIKDGGITKALPIKPLERPEHAL